MTSEAPADVMTVDPMPECPWIVGKTYWCANHYSRVLIVSTKLRAKYPILGIRLAADHDDEDTSHQWAANGMLNDEPGVLDLTTELA